MSQWSFLPVATTRVGKSSETCAVPAGTSRSFSPAKYAASSVVRPVWPSQLVPWRSWVAASGSAKVAHGRLCTSTDTTAGKSRTIGAHESPPSAEP